ncbi:methylmalonyl Co-A mutase-associated GTPase MeaB, partial [Escherichia coli]|nr:methylmalonyl Co-A mutase-associated GTPase MeaB [Escherichia coli]
EQAQHWFGEEVRMGLLRRLEADPAIRARMSELGQAVAAGQTSVSGAAAEMLGELS